jgi:hypothetical protein
MKKSTLKKIQKWQQAKEKLDHYKELESQLRDDIVFDLCGSAVTTGVTKFDFDSDDCVQTIVITQSLRTELNNDISKDSHLFRTMSNEIGVSIDDLLRTTYALQLKVYNDLPKKFQKYVDRYVTKKPNKPSLKIIGE